MENIRVFSPGTIGNIGPGFDVLGLAIKGLGDIVEARKIPSGIVVKANGSKWNVPLNSRENTASLAAQHVLDILGEKGGMEITLTKGLPIGSGLGSSAASAAAGAFAANFLYGNKLLKEELILPATKAEAAVSGGFFADNTAPALLGGATLTRSCEPLDVTRIGSIDALKLIIVIPELVVLTKDARAILPQFVNLRNFVMNMANTALITAAFSKNDYGLFSRCLNDTVIEPVRCSLIKGYHAVRKKALEAGADGMAISGSGPALFAITNSADKAKAIQKAMVEGFKENGVPAEAYITEVDEEGTRLLSN